MGVLRVVQGCFMGISGVFYGYFFYILGAFAYVKWMFDEWTVSSVQVIFVDIFWVLIGVSRLSQLFFRVVLWAF